MIIEKLEQVTKAVLDEMKRTPDARTKEILHCLVTHLHAFVLETRLTEKEFDQAIKYITALGQLTTESHNEVRLMMGSLGISTLVCLLNNGPNAATETSANLLGPFWRAGSPRTKNGGRALLFFLRAGCATKMGGRFPAQRWTYGTLLPSACMKIRTPSRRR
jgi:catechol 1,2-dioxygenase